MFLTNMLTCYDIANYFIWLANESGSYISNLKLQKLVYYAQAWHLAIKGTPLFKEDFQAWVHGPVIPEFFDRYQHFKWKPIIEDVKEPNLPEETMKFLGEVAEEYFACDAYELERMTHIEAPWIDAREGLPMDAASNAFITQESMKIFYAARVKEEA